MKELNLDFTKMAEMEAKILLNHATYLSKASTSNNQMEMLSALDANLKLWVEIETALKSSRSLLPKEVKENLLKLSKYVERLTLSKGVKMTKSDFDSLVNINMQISEGLLESVKNTLAQQEAFSLLKCAIDLSSARETKNTEALVTALDNNMKLWVYIKTLAGSKDSQLPQNIKTNLTKLADYVSGKTLEVGKNLHNLNQRALDSMIMTNLQISEGLISNATMEAASAKKFTANASAANPAAKKKAVAAAAKKPATKKAAVKKPAVKKAVAKKPAKKVVAKKPVKKAVAKKPAAKKVAAKKPAKKVAKKK